MTGWDLFFWNDAMSKTIENRLLLLARKYLQFRPEHLELLEAEIIDGQWTSRSFVFLPMEVAYASAQNDWFQIDQRLSSMISNWSNGQLEVSPLPPIAKPDAGTRAEAVAVNAEAENQKPRQRGAAQDAAVLDAICKAGHDPRALPVNRPGKPGVKAEIHAELLEINIALFPRKSTVFNKTWERLRERGDIVDKA